ncbi:IS5 family transposase [Bradyrhizobium sp. CCGUVB4N]|uniref:IS5 family transposase n=1 Tax=Bradyrhizobium sp. CCGUVB4N TaxID=2949631 RepID=UPI002114A96D|nr:IS5 family transposase [Bradyrhizobium sp. CCGUVB4N]
MSRADLTETRWQMLDPLLPDRGERGPPILDKRRTVNGILWVLRTGAPWRDMPERYGKWNSVFIRFTRWSKLGVWDAAFETLASLGPAADEEHAIDSTIIRAHQHAAGVKGGNQNQEALGRSRGGFSTKVHIRTNAEGHPLTFDITGGEVHEVNGYDALMELHDLSPRKLLGDKGYDSDAIRADLVERGIEAVIPPRSNRTIQIKYDREAYKHRNLVERCVNRIKQFRRVATRYEKTARAFLSMLSIAAAMLWIRTVNTT